MLPLSGDTAEPSSWQESSPSARIPHHIQDTSEDHHGMVQIGSRNTLSSVVSSAFQLSDDAEEISLLWASWQRVQNTTHTSHADQDQTESKETKTKEREFRWATLEQLLDRLLFFAVSGDDPAYITHFLLTYRRFASPQSLLLAMHKRVLQLDSVSSDPMIDCWAQMRICRLLDLWTKEHPSDFAGRSTTAMLSAFVQSIIERAHLLHYGADLVSFLEVAPSLYDKDASWAFKRDLSIDNLHGTKLDAIRTHIPQIESKPPPPVRTIYNTVPHAPMASREHRPGSLLTLKWLVMPNHSGALYACPSSTSLSKTKLIRDLVKVAGELNALDANDIAQEITRLEVKLFLDIEPRHWLQFIFSSGKKDPQTDFVTRFNQVSNHLADWVVSLILCHDRSKARARQIDKFVEVAQRLRLLNNYSALRAFVAGINNAMLDDEIMEQLKHVKLLQSWDILFQHRSGHHKYRLAFRNTKGACIPALEVHLSDIIRAHEGNLDYNPNDPTQLHWAKFAMIGKFIAGIVQGQVQCRAAQDYNFAERPHILRLIFRGHLMDEQMQKSRIPVNNVVEN